MPFIDSEVNNSAASLPDDASNKQFADLIDRALRSCQQIGESAAHAIAANNEAFSRRLQEAARRASDNLSIFTSSMSSGPFQEIQSALGQLSTRFGQVAMDFSRQFSDRATEALLAPLRNTLALLCDVKGVSVDITSDSKPFLRTRYDRSTLIDLLTGVILYKAAHPDAEVGLSSEIEESNSLFECGKPHRIHKAKYDGKIVVNTKSSTENRSTNLSEWLDEERQQGSISEDKLYQAEMDARRAELVVRRLLADVVCAIMPVLIEASIKYVDQDPLSTAELEKISRALGDILWNELPRRGSGGANRKPGFDWCDDNKRTDFMGRVNEIRPLWEEALNNDDEIKWGDQWFDMLKGNARLAKISKALLREALCFRKRCREQGDRILPDHSASAYSLKQAAIQFEIINKKSNEVYKFDTLKKYYDGTLPAMKGKRNKKR